jgi:putative ABC transport system substrate-binding protein
MSRRSFLIGVAAAIASPHVARSQPSVRRVGVLLLYATEDPVARGPVNALREALHELGWTEGQDLEIQFRFAGGNADRMRAAASDLIEEASDVIVVQAPSVIREIRQRSPVPVVFASAADPVQVGLMATPSHPENNVTGFVNFEYAVSGKWLQLIKQAAPHVTRVGFLFDPWLGGPGGSFFWPPFAAAARALGVDAIRVPIRNIADIKGGMAELGREQTSGHAVMPGVSTSANHAQIVELATHHRLPGCYAFRYFATDGGLMAYGPNSADMFRRAASYVDRILRGERAADLPIQQPNKYDLVINLKTATALGLDVPRALLARADEVIK